MTMISLVAKLFLVTVTLLPWYAFAQTWCGKHYMPSQPVVPPGGRFPEPKSSSSPLLALRCGPAVKPYLAEDALNTDKSFVSILVNTPVVFSEIANAAAISIPRARNDLNVVVSTADGKVLTRGIVPLNSTNHAMPFNLARLKPRKEPYSITCTATIGKQTFTSSASVSILPPAPASVTRMDMRSGALLARPPSGKGPYSPVFPFGFYTNFDGYLAKNLSVIQELKSQGFNMIHPVPTFGNLTLLGEVLDEMERVGMYLMYDMRGTYKNLTSVEEQVKLIRYRPNLLLWYTADEPDGWGDSVDAPLLAYETILSLDDGYHPTSLVLNCENFHFTEYTRGTEIIMQDAYTIGNNLTFSTEWGTPCTEDYGDCGCDNCHLGFEDIAVRMDEYKERIRINGWELEKAVWAVPQAFGGESYWKRPPTGKEFVVQSILAINHGGLGIVPWLDPTPADIKASASALALSLPRLNPYILGLAYSINRRQITINRVDIGIWTAAQRQDLLILVTNMNAFEVELDVGSLVGRHASLKGVLHPSIQSGVRLNRDGKMVLEALGSGAFVSVEFVSE